MNVQAVEGVRVEHYGAVAALRAQRPVYREAALKFLNRIAEKGGGRGSRGGLLHTGLSCGLGGGSVSV